MQNSKPIRVVQIGSFPVLELPLTPKGLQKHWTDFFENKKSIYSHLCNVRPPIDFIEKEDDLWKFIEHRLCVETKPNESSRAYGRANFYLPSAPFAPGVGSFQLSTRMIRFSERGSAPIVTNMVAEKDKDMESFQYKIFGYEPESEDQRHWLFMYELCKPVLLSAELTGGTTIKCTIYVHIYPSGIGSLVCSFLVFPSADEFDVNKVIVETRPWKKSKLKWKRASHPDSTLFSHLETIKGSLVHSFFLNRSQRLNLRWTTVVGLDQLNCESSEILKNISPFEEIEFSEFGKYVGKVSFGQHGTLTTFKNLKNDKHNNAIKFFWKLVFVLEYIELRLWAIDLCANYFTNRKNELLKWRMKPISKFSQENILKFSQYSDTLPDFLEFMDKNVAHLPPLYRKLYSLRCNAVEFDKYRNKSKLAYSEWLKEVEKWEHPISSALRLFFLPFKKIFG